VPWPGGSAAKSVGCGVRELPASASGFASGAFGSVASGIFTGGDGVALETFMAKILGSLLATLTGRRQTLYESELPIPRHRGRSRCMVNGRLQYP
jgi:hypothetical protein